MKTLRLLGMCALAGLAGCLHQGQRELAFTRDWADQEAKKAEFEARQAYVRGDGGLPWLSNTRLVAVDKTGKARFNLLGQDTHWGANLSFRGGKPSVKVKYTIEWTGPRPEKEEVAPNEKPSID